MASVLQSTSFLSRPFHATERRRPLCSCPRTLRVSSAAAKRTGNRRYPSEKKKLRKKQKELVPEVEDKFQGIWRFSKLSVSVPDDPGKDSLDVSPGLLSAVSEALKFPIPSMIPPEAISIVRKSFDARKVLKEPKFVYTVDVDVDKLVSMEPRAWDFVYELEPRIGHVEHVTKERVLGDLVSVIRGCKETDEGMKETDGVNDSGKLHRYRGERPPKVVIVGSGPAGLFASLVLAELGADVTVVERGEPVEQRGRDIGALVVRRILARESNFCFGEGGAGTWSDGKLVTRIGRNSNSVLAVMNTLVRFGAPKNILVGGKPHLGTDRLIPLLRNFRSHLQTLGVSMKFGSRVDDLLVENGFVVGVKVADSRNKLQPDYQKLGCDAVVLAVGHSARDMYEVLLSHNVHMVPKDFAVGFRIEHPQELINGIQYPGLATEVRSGRGKVPVADYKVASYVELAEDSVSSSGHASRSCYSFCMCPGGQVVLTSTDPSELCINGMSFSRRSSKWANAALVASVSNNDFGSLGFHGPLAGVEFQREFERAAAVLGGGNFVVPVQRVTDFLENKITGTSLPSSSYRLGVKEANLHELYPAHITRALKDSISKFEKELPGFISTEALLHGVETRTSSPVQITRGIDSCESISLKGLYPIGEGAGYAGGIVSAAVDGMNAGFRVAKSLGLFLDGLEKVSGKSQGGAVVKY